MRSRKELFYGNQSEDESTAPSAYKKKMQLLEKKGLLEDWKRLESLRQKISYQLQTPKQRKKSNELANTRMRNKRSRDKKEEDSKKRLDHVLKNLSKIKKHDRSIGE